MKVCFVVSDLRASGGVDVVLQYADALANDHGVEVDLVASNAAALASASTVGRLVLAPDVADEQEYDIAISTWWETAQRAWSLRARRRIAFVQSAEECFYDEGQILERLGAALALRAADGYIAVSSWLATLVGGLRPDAPVTIVRNGIDKDVFDGRRVERNQGPLRVLVEGQPSLHFKGVGDALRVLAHVDAPLEVTLVCRDPGDSAALEVDRVVGGLSPAEMADLYASTDVLVKLSSLEGLGLAPLEAFHHGVPCIVTPYGGHEEYLRHGDNGFLVGFGDLQAVPRIVDRLAQDRELLKRLSQGARETALDWPGPAASAARFAEALQGFRDQAEPPVEPLLQAWRAAAEQDRPYRGALAWHEAALAETRGALDEQIAHVARLNDLVGALYAQLDEVRASRAYRVAVGARSLVSKVRR